jgi:hypothetical protein
MNWQPSVITLDERISKTERFLRLLEADRPHLNARVAPLGPEQRESVNSYAAWVRAETEAELKRLRGQR